MNRRIISHLVEGLMIALLLAGCGIDQAGSQSHTPRPTQVVSPVSVPTPTVQQTTGTPIAHSSNTVFLIMMENHNWSDIAGNPAARYINNSLLPMSSYAKAYYNPPGIHPSEPNYLWLEAGTNFGISNDGEPASNHQATPLHLSTLLDHAHISWKSYQENISGNDCPLVSNDLYATKHNPTIFFDDVTDTNNPQSGYCIAHERPYTELAGDLQKNSVARYNFITPNICNDMHNSCAPLNDAVQQGDTWLSQQIPTIVASQAYKNGGIIFITWDEDEGTDGPIGLIVLSSYAKGHGYTNTIPYTHSSTLRTIEELFKIGPLLGDATRATDLHDLFQQFPG